MLLRKKYIPTFTFLWLSRFSISNFLPLLFSCSLVHVGINLSYFLLFCLSPLHLFYPVICLRKWIFILSALLSRFYFCSTFKGVGYLFSFDPRVTQQFRTGESLTWNVLETSIEKLLALLCQIFRKRRVYSTHNIADNFLEIIGKCSPRRPSRQHLNNHAAKTPNISWYPMPFSPQYLWSHIVWCPLNGCILRNIFHLWWVFNMLGSSKISYFEGAILHNQDIGTFKIPMHYILFMEMSKSL